ncbi:MAG: putative metal-binding motif-containing protein [Deltaproteobacteria bacterium]|nr:putative metal-binding motif-containing protein [Deltaproteobacteria bacterium]
MWTLLLACVTDPPEKPTTDAVVDSALDSGMDSDCPPQDWFEDQDQDGWGASEGMVTACAPPLGFVGRSGDCDDSASTVFPGALDVSDGVDQDCDGFIDESGVELVFDPGAGTHPWLGLGAHVWIWDDLWPTVLTALHGRMIRSSLYSLDDPDSAPAGGSDAEFDAWLLTHDTAHEAAVMTVATAQAAGLSVIALVWEAPPAWETAGALRAEHVTDQARLTAAIVARLAEAGAAPDSVELLNEPDGDWNSTASPSVYASLLRETRAALDARGLTHIPILGPGLAFAQSTEDWTAHIDPADLGGLSTHLWDDAYGAGDGVDLARDAAARFAAASDRLDPSRSLPRIITEIGSKDTALHGVPTNGADTCGDFPDATEYAVRLFAYTLITAAEGAGAVLPWQAADLDWGGCWGTWGLVDMNGAPRPSLDTLAQLGAVVPEGAAVVPPRWQDPELAAVGFVRGDSFVLALANPTAADVTRIIGIAGSSAWRLTGETSTTTDAVLIRDSLDSGAGFAVDGSVWIDTANTAYFDGDAGRLAANDNAVVTWAFDAEVTQMEAQLWVWSGVGSTTWEASVDGLSWSPITPVAYTPTSATWAEHRLRFEALPAGTRAVRMVFESRSVAWTPQLGALDVTLAPGAPSTADLLSAERLLVVTVPAESTRVVELGR